VFDIHGPAISCEEFREAIRVAPSGSGGSAAPLWEAASAMNRVDGSDCFSTASRASTPTSPNRLRVTFGPDGHVVAAVLEAGPFVGTATAKCLSGLFADLRVPPYKGGAFTLHRESSRFFEPSRH
jgi:hypothetical protein